jgi:hypothetical protein
MLKMSDDNPFSMVREIVGVIKLGGGLLGKSAMVLGILELGIIVAVFRLHSDNMILGALGLGALFFLHGSRPSFDSHTGIPLKSCWRARSGQSINEYSWLPRKTTLRSQKIWPASSLHPVQSGLTAKSVLPLKRNLDGKIPAYRNRLERP